MSGKDLEIRYRLKPEPPTERELAGMKNMDDVDFEIFRHRMQMITHEGKETAIKLGASTAVRWGDVGMAIYTNSGDIAISAAGIRFHTVLGSVPLKYVLKHWKDDPSVGIKEGDAFFYTDPLYAGVHTSDMGYYTPVFYNGEIVCWVGCVVHSGESGATEPGGMPLTSRSRYDDGIHIPPVKITENYHLREDVVNLLAHMVRDPRGLILDIKARAAACGVARRRLLETIEKKGPDFTIGGLRRLIKLSSEAARAKVSKLNDGVYRFPRFMDTVGTEDALLKLMVTVRKKGEKLYLDLTDTSPEVPDRPINTQFMGVLGLSAVYLGGYMFYDLPVNSGFFEAMEWNFPENTIVNPNPEAPVSLAPWTQCTFEHGFSQVGAKMLYALDPERAVACWFRGFNAAYYGGLNQWGEPTADICPDINAGGTGGRSDKDGVNIAGAFFATMSDTGDMESIEIEKPFLYLFRRYFRDSHGFGNHRGGAGADYAIMIKDVPWMYMGCFGYGSKIPSTMGLFGGYALPTFVVTKIKKNNLLKMMERTDPRVPYSTHQVLEEKAIEGKYEYWPISCPGEVLSEGDLFIAGTGGGAGFGDVLERNPQAVVRDVYNGITSEWAARNIYLVDYNPETLTVNLEETEELRRQEREKRKSRGMPYHEFVRKWQSRRPDDHALRYYGNWPNPSRGRQEG